MKKIVIRVPIWKTRSIGLAEDKLDKLTKIEISYKTKEGKKLYPGSYILEKEKALKYPIQFRKGRKLRIIPINDLEKI